MCARRLTSAGSPNKQRLVALICYAQRIARILEIATDSHRGACGPVRVPFLVVATITSAPLRVYTVRCQGYSVRPTTHVPFVKPPVVAMDSCGAKGRRDRAMIWVNLG